jgi:hypothetical protein
MADTGSDVPHPAPFTLPRAHMMRLFPLPENLRVDGGGIGAKKPLLFDF